MRVQLGSEPPCITCFRGMSSGRVVSRTGLVSYEVDVGEVIWSRHVDQLVARGDSGDGPLSGGRAALEAGRELPSDRYGREVTQPTLGPLQPVGRRGQDVPAAAAMGPLQEVPAGQGAPTTADGGAHQPAERSGQEAQESDLGAAVRDSGGGVRPEVQPELSFAGSHQPSAVDGQCGDPTVAEGAPALAAGGGPRRSGRVRRRPDRFCEMRS